MPPPPQENESTGNSAPAEESEQRDELERLFAGEELRLLAMFIMGMSVGICLTLLWLDVF